MVLATLAIALVAAAVAYGTAVTGYASAGTAYAARVACSCRFVAGRSLADCAKDKVAGMELVRLSQDEASRTVTATFPLIRSDRASLVPAYGCVLQRWSP